MAESCDTASLTLVDDIGEDYNAKKSLCCRCKKIGLGPERFIVNTPTVAADIIWQPQRYEPRKANSDFSLKSGTNHQDFATLEDLNKNKNSCSFCYLLCRAIHRYSGGVARKVDAKITCSLLWEVHGRVAKSQSSFVNSTRRIRLSWDDRTGHTQEVFLLFVAPREASRPNSDAHHDECCFTHGTEDEFNGLIKETYFGVIDVADMQLKSLPLNSKGDPEPFVALSYVWGQGKLNESPYVTNRLNIMTHIQHGGLETIWDKLPRTLQDTILLVSRLGYRYLWIDSLCIVQDSERSWQLNARAMHLVYGNALFTICAADGRDSSAGLRAAEAILRVQGPIAAATNGRVQHLDDGADAQPMSEDIGNGVRLMVTRPLETTVDDSEWNKRAWTFQERVLSRRCLIFAESRIYFQCRTTHFSQDIYADGGSHVFSLDRANSPLRTLHELRQRPFWFCVACVRMYTGRQLTKPRDVLAAFEGIAWLLEQYIEAPSLFGIPTSHFDLALLSTLLTKTRLRRPRAHSQSATASCTQDAMGNCTCNLEQRSFEAVGFPTWSWAGWMDGRIGYDPAMLEGCLTNVREWLTRHTWIQWHIRDEKGHLRPLWDIMTNKTERHDRQWLGYPVVNIASNSNAGPHGSPSRPRAAPYSPIVGPPDRGLFPPDRTRATIVTERQLTPITPEPHLQRPAVSFDDTVHPEFGSDDSHGDDDASSTRSYTTARRYRQQRVSNTKYVDNGSRSYNNDYSGPREVRRMSKMCYDEERVTNIEGTKPRKTPRGNQSPSSASSSSSIGRSSYNGDGGGSDDEREDGYGRRIRKGRVPREVERKGSLKFNAILPDNPFGVIRDVPPSPQTGSRRPGGKSKTSRLMPSSYMPILQFYTWRTELHVVMRDSDNNNTTETTPDNKEKPTQCDILDKSGDWCGAIALEDAWIRVRQNHIFQFVAVSDARGFTLDERPVWTYYFPHERDESAWDVYFVLLLQRNAERGLWERVGLGKVFKAVFEREGSWDEVKLG
ncbi:heterokaryon incompatibility protein-domain-containing protein [Xylariaceae sp. AK1471]|nr:heterokaryon incompatibility protein-domain-containing protein [Xylariaceae sp. AK1471]